MTIQRPLLAIRHPTMLSHAKIIIASVLSLYRLHPDDFYGFSREVHLVAARKEAANRLIEAGYSAAHVARIMKRNHTTILSYLPKLRQAKSERYFNKRLLQHLSPEAREVVIAVAKAEDVAPYVVMAQWIGERARHEAETKARDAA